MSYSKVLALTAFGGALFMQGCGEDDESDACNGQTLDATKIGEDEYFGLDDDCVKCVEEDQDTKIKEADSADVKTALDKCGFTFTHCSDISEDIKDEAVTAPGYFHAILDELVTNGEDQATKDAAKLCKTCVSFLAMGTSKTSYAGCEAEKTALKTCGATDTDLGDCDVSFHCALDALGDCSDCLNAEGEEATWAETKTGTGVGATVVEAKWQSAMDALATCGGVQTDGSASGETADCDGATEINSALDFASGLPAGVVLGADWGQCFNCFYLGTFEDITAPTCKETFAALNACGYPIATVTTEALFCPSS